MTIIARFRQIGVPVVATRMRAIVKVDQQGRVLIPKEMRDAAGMRPEGRVTLLVENGEIRVITPAAARQRLRELSAKYSTGDRSLVDELIAERRAEAERE